MKRKDKSNDEGDEDRRGSTFVAREQQLNGVGRGVVHFDELYDGVHICQKHQQFIKKMNSMQGR